MLILDTRRSCISRLSIEQTQKINSLWFFFVDILLYFNQVSTPTLDQLPLDHQTLDLLDMMVKLTLKSNSGPNKHTCDLCRLSDYWVSSVSYCENCAKNLCEACFEWHCGMTTFATHKVIQVRCFSCHYYICLVIKSASGDCLKYHITVQWSQRSIKIVLHPLVSIRQLGGKSHCQ